MSFYGNIKRVDSSPWIFDRVFPNRKDMEDHINDDQIYVGRYVLINYTCKYKDDSDERESLIFFNKYEESSNSDPIEQDDINIEVDTQKKLIFTKDYSDNIKADINAYSQTYNSTVWQKVYLKNTNNDNEEYVEKYILIAELNANIPKISLETAPALTIKDGEETWNELGIYKKPVTATDEELVFQIPSFNLQVENPQRYKYSETNPNDNSEKIIDMYGQEWINNPRKKFSIYKKDSDIKITPEEVLSGGDLYNYFKWDYIKDENNNITGKKLTGEVLSIGALISQLYDILYGSDSNNNGERIGYNTKMPEIPEYGLVGLLDSIAPVVIYRPTLDQEPDPLKTYYYYENNSFKEFTGSTFSSDTIYYEKINKAYSIISQWQNADEAGTSGTYIEGIPEVIGASNDWDENSPYCSISYDYQASQQYLKIPTLVQSRMQVREKSFILDDDVKGILGSHQIVIQ